MQFSHYLVLTFLVIFSVANLANGLAHTINKPVYLTFREITNTILALENSEKSSSPSSPPDFKESSKLLVQLAQEADEATSLLKQMGDKTLLDEMSIKDIKSSLHKSAEHVKSITKMVEAGKTWFDQYNVTAQIVHILQTNAFQFQLLFRELEYHTPPTHYSELGKPITLFMCSIINAIHALDPSACAPQGLETCQAFAKNEKNCFNGDSLDGATKAPTGMDSCDNSATKYLQCAYNEKTLGTNNVQCTSDMKNNGKFKPQFAFFFS